MFRFLATLALLVSVTAHAEIASQTSHIYLPPGNSFAATPLPVLEVPASAIAETVLVLPPPSAAAMAAREKHQIGFAASLATDQQRLPALLDAAAWTTHGDRRLARLTIQAPSMAALRIGLSIGRTFPGRVIVLDAAGAPESDMQRQGDDLLWSPFATANSQTLLIDTPADYRFQTGDLAIPMVSLLDQNPLQLADNHFANIDPTTASCAIDLACESNSVQKSAGSATMLLLFTKAGGSYACTGTLLADKSQSNTPYIYTANHCLDSQTVASTLNTIWNLQYANCSSSNTGKPSYTKLSNGAVLLDHDVDNDHAFLQLNDTPPAGAVFLGWSTALLQSGMSVISINHPHGDVKKISYGSVKSPSASAATVGTYHSSVWRIDVTRGASQEGSSGGGLLTCDSQSCYLRGGVLGGVDSQICSGHSDVVFSRFDTAYPRIKSWLDSASTTPPATTTAAPLSSLSFTNWPTTITANSVANVGTLTAGYSDDSRKTVTATVTSSNSRLLSISNGQLLAGNVSSDTSVTLSASYSENGQTVTSNLAVTIRAPVTTPIIAPATPADSSIDCLFTWAEATYPELFAPAAPATKLLGIYTYRYYRTSNSYLATIANDSNFYYIGPLSNGRLLGIGLLSTWLNKAKCQ